jgi:hypothetical protein
MGRELGRERWGGWWGGRRKEGWVGRRVGQWMGSRGRKGRKGRKGRACGGLLWRRRIRVYY